MADIATSSGDQATVSHSRFKASYPIDNGVPKNLLYAGIIVGLLLISFGIGLLVAGNASLLSSLMTCVGFGIVLASFGSKAGGTWAGWTATGAGAMAILLFLVLEYYTPTSSLTPARRGQLRGDLSKIGDIRIIDETPMYQFRDATTASIKFIVLDRVLKSQRMSVQVDTTEKGPGREFFELIGNSKLISNRYLLDQKVGVIQWEFDYANRVIRDGQTVIFAEADKLDENMLPRRQANNGLVDWSFTPIDAAFAQSPGLSWLTTPLVVSDLIGHLKSNDTAVRRNARDTLWGCGPEVVAELMAELRASPSDYRLKGGVIYVLSTMLKHLPDQKSSISAALKDEDFPILVAAASDDDKTIRLQAAEFLYVLGDPRSIPYSVDAARETRDNDKAWNQIKITRQSGQQLSVPDKQKILRDLQTGPSPNNDLVGRSGWTCRTLFGGC